MVTAVIVVLVVVVVVVGVAVVATYSSSSNGRVVVVGANRGSGRVAEVLPAPILAAAVFPARDADVFCRRADAGGITSSWPLNLALCGVFDDSSSPHLYTVGPQPRQNAQTLSWRSFIRQNQTHESSRQTSLCNVVGSRRARRLIPARPFYL